MKEYVSLREAIAELNNTSDDKEICAIVQGKVCPFTLFDNQVIKVLDGDGYTAINKSCVELRTSQFDESSGNWKDQVKTRIHFSNCMKMIVSENIDYWL